MMKRSIKNVRRLKKDIYPFNFHIMNEMVAYAKINPRYKDLVAHVDMKIHRPLKKGIDRKGGFELNLGSGDASEWDLINEKMGDYLSEIAKDTKYSVYCYSYKQSLTRAISLFENKYRKTNYSEEDILLSGTGSAGCFFSLHNVLLTPGDEVLTIVPSHYYFYPLTVVTYFGHKTIGSPAIEEESWKPNIDDMRNRISSKTSLIAITSPSNPTGKIYSEKELKAIVDLAGEFEIPIISDECEGLITFNGLESISLSRIAGDVPCFITSSMSKVFGSPGWSLGYTCIHDPEDKIVEVKKTLRALAYSYGHPGDRFPTPIVVAATKAYEEGWLIPDLLPRLEKQREFAWKRLNEIEGISCIKSMGTYWQFPRIDEIKKNWKTDEDFISELWEEKGLGFRPGTPWGEGGFGHFRIISLPQIEVLEDAFNRLENFMKSHT